MKKLIICSTQRSGSSFFCECVSEYGWGAPKEYYLPQIRKLRRNEEYDFSKGIEKIERRNTKNNIFAVKVMSNYLANLEFVHEQILLQTNNANGLPKSEKKEPFPFDSFREYYQDATWIWLKRENTVKQALSRIKARKTKIYHSPQALTTQNSNRKKGRIINFPTRTLDKEIFKISCENTIWSEFFSKHKIDPIKVTYEDLVLNRQQIMESLGDQLKLEKYPSSEEPKLKKLSNSSVEGLYDTHIIRLLRTVSVAQ